MTRCPFWLFCISRGIAGISMLGRTTFSRTLPRSLIHAEKSTVTFADGRERTRLWPLRRRRLGCRRIRQRWIDGNYRPNREHSVGGIETQSWKTRVGRRGVGLFLLSWWLLVSLRRCGVLRWRRSILNLTGSLLASRATGLRICRSHLSRADRRLSRRRARVVKGAMHGRRLAEGF